MAKRPQPKSKPAPESPSPHRGERNAAPTPASSPIRRSTYVEAVALYEKGIEALQRHDYALALERLQSVLTLFPEERELHERVRLYLNVCQQHATPRQVQPETVDERLYAATLAINLGRHDEAIAHLRLVRDEVPDHDHALYMLGVAHALRGDHAEALVHLERAIVINPENRALARRDPDLEPLRGDDAFWRALEAVQVPTPRPGSAPVETPSRPKFGR